MSNRPWRVLDTGALPAADNMCLDEVILAARHAGIVPNTLRFLQFKPRAVLVGHHQDVAQEVRLDWCKKNGVEVNRRLTGGGAIFWDETQLGWEIFAAKNAEGIPRRAEEIYRLLAEGTIRALRRLGVDASFRPVNDIEVHGRKISGTGGTEWGEAFLFQGTLLVDFDVDGMLRSLRLPAEKLRDKDVASFRERVTCLREELGKAPSLPALKEVLVEGFSEVLGVEFVPAELHPWESERWRNRRAYFASVEWVERTRKDPELKGTLTAVHKAPGGLIRAAVAVDRPSGQVLQAFITGDFFAYPSRLIPDLEAALKFAPADPNAVTERIEDFFAGREYQLPGVSPADFVTVMSRALGKLRFTEYGFTAEEANRLFVIGGDPESLEEPEALLLPYCAKLLSCKYRQADGCDECGLCSVGDAYKLGRNASLRVVSINNYEELESTLESLRRQGVRSFVGSCCQAFYGKHQADFERLGLPGLLVDIRNTTCYDLGEEAEAHRGEFERETELDLALLQKALAFLNRRVKSGEV